MCSKALSSIITDKLTLKILCPYITLISHWKDSMQNAIKKTAIIMAMFNLKQNFKIFIFIGLRTKLEEAGVFFKTFHCYNCLKTSLNNYWYVTIKP